MRTWIALLRAINLGDRNKVSMQSLRSVLLEGGLSDVRTYLQTGNVVFRSASTEEAEVQETVRSLLESQFDFEIPVLIRDASSWQRLRNPFPTMDLVHVVFLQDRPAAEAAHLLEDRDWSPDQLLMGDREVFIGYHESMHGSRLQHAAVLRPLNQTGTARTWRTVERVAAMLAA